MNLADIVSRRAEAAPQSPAVIDHGRALSYRELDNAIWRAAADLRRQGVAAGDVVALAMRSGALYLVATYALARLNAVYLALAAEETPARHADLVRRFGAKVLLADRKRAAMPGPKLVHPDAHWLEADSGAPDESLRGPGGDAGWRIGLTSGSTGTPKAVMITHAMQAFWCEANQGALPGLPGDRFLSILSLDFDAGLRICLFVHWAGGAVLFEPAMPNAAQFCATVERCGANYLSLTPLHLARLLGDAPQKGPRLPGVRVLRSGGMLHTDDVQREVRQRITPNLYVMYGTKDGGSPLTCASGEILERFPGTVGFPCPGVELGIAGEDGRALPAGTPGLVRMKAKGMMRGYIDDAAATARQFRDGWYYTGDRGTLTPEGALQFLGRADDLINFDGIKIYPSEIEAALLAHPGVAEAAVFAVPAERHQDLPMAAVVARGGELDAGELLGWCRQRLGTRAPHRILAVRALPRTAAGKVDKRRLAGELAALAAKRR